MIEIQGRIPLLIHPMFWVFSGFIGWAYSGSFVGMLTWVGIIFGSVLVHEFGHAITAVFFKQKARIQLIAFGGVTSYEGGKLNPWQRFIIVFNGPCFSFLLFLGTSYALTFSWPPMLVATLEITKFANLFWTIVNLFPIYPLDGGQLLRIILETRFGIGGFKASLMIGTLLSALLSFTLFVFKSYLGGALFFLFAFQSFDLWKKHRIATKSDRDERLQKLLLNGEMALEKGKKEEAKDFFSQICNETKNGVLGLTAAQYLAILLSAEGKEEEAYELLLPLQDHLALDTKCLLHRLGAGKGNAALVAKLSTECYQFAPSQEMALNNARAFAHLKMSRNAGGWLQTAWKNGGLSLEKTLSEECFKSLIGQRDFDQFIDQIRKSNQA